LRFERSNGRPKQRVESAKHSDSVRNESGKQREAKAKTRRRATHSRFNERARRKVYATRKIRLRCMNTATRITNMHHIRNCSGAKQQNLTSRCVTRIPFRIQRNRSQLQYCVCPRASVTLPIRLFRQSGKRGARNSLTKQVD
jgi:hypothetical protein